VGDFSNVESENRIIYSNEKWGMSIDGSTRKRQVASASARIVFFADTHVAITFPGDLRVWGLMM